jgi:hypothetical protein
VIVIKTAVSFQSPALIQNRSLAPPLPAQRAQIKEEPLGAGRHSAKILSTRNANCRNQAVTLIDLDARESEQ